MTTTKTLRSDFSRHASMMSILTGCNNAPLGNAGSGGGGGTVLRGGELSLCSGGVVLIGGLGFCGGV